MLLYLKSLTRPYSRKLLSPFVRVGCLQQTLWKPIAQEGVRIPSSELTSISGVGQMTPVELGQHCPRGRRTGNLVLFFPSSYYGPCTVPSALWDSAHCFLLPILDGTVSDLSFDEKAQTQRYRQQRAQTTVRQGVAGPQGPEFLRCLKLGSCFTLVSQNKVSGTCFQDPIGKTSCARKSSTKDRNDVDAWRCLFLFVVF